MSETIYWRSRTLLKRDRVRCTGKTERYQYFQVDENYQVKIALTDLEHNCTCQHGSIWGVGKKCSHIEACLLWLLGEK